MYGKLLNGNLRSAPNVLVIGNTQVWNASAEQYLDEGWKLVVFTEPPEAPTGYYYESGWSEDETEITQTWTLTELPDDVDEAEAFEIIFGGEE